MIDAFTFVTFYTRILKDLKGNLNPIYHPVIEELLKRDPHDMVTPETTFKDYSQMYEFILHKILSNTPN
jgi:hypothetical protein